MFRKMGFQKFVGKVVEGQDPEQRGRYYVHIPDLQPHLPESKGYLCTNSTGGSRMTNSDRGCYGGQHTPLHPGTVVQVECHTDDINSLRIKDIVSDDSPKTDMSPGKIMGVEPSGHVKQVAVSGLPEDLTAKASMIVMKINEILNSGSALAQSLLMSVQSQLGEFYNELSKAFDAIEGEINDAINGVVGEITEEIDKAADSLKDAMDDVLGGIIGGINDGLKELGSAFDSALDDISKEIDSVTDAISKIKIEAFDTAEIQKQFEEISKEANKNLKLATKEIQDILGPSFPISTSTQLTSVKDIIGNQTDPAKYKEALNKIRDFRAKQILATRPVLMSRSRGMDISAGYDSLPDDIKDMIDVELGVMNEKKYVNKKKSEWEKKNANNVLNVTAGGTSKNGADDRPEYNYGEGTKKPNNNERDEQYTVLLTPDKNGIYINENTENDKGSIYIVYQGKQTAIRINDGGIHISTDNSFLQKITVNRDIVIDGSSSITVNGGNYDIYVNGNVNLAAEGDINMHSKKNINITADNNIRLNANNSIVSRSGKAQFIESKAILSKTSKGFEFNTDGLFCIHATEVSTVSSASTSINSGQMVAIDGSQVHLNSGKSSKSSPNSKDLGAVVYASPKKRPVCKI